MANSKQKVPSGKAKGEAGFTSFKNDTDGLFYFQYKDGSGRAILTSNGYPTARDRSNALLSVKYHFSNPDKYTQSKEGKSYYFDLLFGKKGEQIRSIAFDTKKNRDQAETGMHGKRKVKKAHKNTSNASDNKSKSIQQPIAKAEPEDMQSRFKFNLTFRKPGEGDPIIGAIEYPLTKEKTSFQDLDLKAIADFISHHLPQVKTIREVAPAEAAIERGLPAAKEQAAEPVRIEAPAPDPIPVEKQMQVTGNETLGWSYLLKKDSNYHFKIELRDIPNMSEGKPYSYDATVYARPKRHTDPIPLGQVTGNIKNGVRTALIPFSTWSFAPSSYQFFVSLDIYRLENDVREQQRIAQVNSSKAFQVM